MAKVRKMTKSKKMKFGEHHPYSSLIAMAMFKHTYKSGKGALEVGSWQQQQHDEQGIVAVGLQAT